MRRLGTAVAVLAALASACGGDDPYAPLPKPDAAPAETTTTTARPDLDAVVLPAARGTTTTTVAVGPGPITILGRVTGPDGPVAGAIVRLERLVGDGSAAVQVPTAADGTWNVERVLGGRYRVRAWQPPQLAMARASVVFVEAGAPEPIELRLDRYEGRRVDAVVAPEPPAVGGQANLKVRVADRVVDDRGVIRTTPTVGVSVQLTGSGSWFVLSSNPQSTGSDGSVTFAVQCQSEGSQPLSVVLQGTETVTLSVPPCVDPNPTSTTTSTSSTTTTSTTEP